MKDAEAIETENHELRKEIEKLVNWINDLQRGCYINCVYCGHRYGPRESGATIPEAGKSMAAALAAHIAQCPKHPMAKLAKYAAAAIHALDSLLACREGIADEMLRDLRIGLAEALTHAGRRIE